MTTLVKALIGCSILIAALLLWRCDGFLSGSKNSVNTPTDVAPRYAATHQPSTHRSVPVPIQTVPEPIQLQHQQQHTTASSTADKPSTKTNETATTELSTTIARINDPMASDGIVLAVPAAHHAKTAGVPSESQTDTLHSPNEEPPTADANVPAPSALNVSSSGITEIADGGKPDNAPSGYEDRLIDPEAASKPENLEDIPGATKPSGNTYHMVTLGSTYTDSSSLPTRFDHGVQYTSFTPTINFGDIRLRMTLLEEDSDDISQFSGLAPRQRGLRRLSIEQSQLPLTQSLLMDNVIGTHLSGENTHYRHINTGTVGQRFNLVSADILGLTSRVRSDTQSLTFSVGAVGTTSGRYLPGFIKQEGDLQQLAFRKKGQSQLLSLELWRTGNVNVNNDDSTRVGWRGAMDIAINENIASHLSLAQSDDSSAILTSMLFQGLNSQHEVGAYYFDPDFIWVRSVIGDDSFGALYKFTGNTRLSTINFSLEHREDTFSNPALSSTRTTQYLTAGWAQRLSRQLNHSAFYSLRRTERSLTSIDDGDNLDHSLRWYATKQHRYDQSSTLRLAYNTNDEFDSWRAHYRWRLSYAEASALSLYIEQETSSEKLSSGSQDSRFYGLGADWQTQIRDFHYVTAGLRYRQDDRSSVASDSSNWGASLAYQWQISSQLELSLQADYNQLDVSIDDTELGNTLFTESTVNTLSEESYNSNATLTLRYEFGNTRQPLIYGQRKRGSRGAGEIHGVVYIDENNDGVFQAHEQRIKGVRLRLDGYHAVNSSADGRYSYASVSPGKHVVSINESELPLPLASNGRQRWEVSVELRKSSQLDIPLSRLD